MSLILAMLAVIGVSVALGQQCQKNDDLNAENDHVRQVADRRVEYSERAMQENDRMARQENDINESRRRYEENPSEENERDFIEQNRRRYMR